MNIFTCFDRETELQEHWQMKQKFSLVAMYIRDRLNLLYYWDSVRLTCTFITHNMATRSQNESDVLLVRGRLTIAHITMNPIHQDLTKYTAASYQLSFGSQFFHSIRCGDVTSTRDCGVGVVNSQARVSWDKVPGKLKWSASPTPSLSGQLIMAYDSVDNIMKAL